MEKGEAGRAIVLPFLLWLVACSGLRHTSIFYRLGYKQQKEAGSLLSPDEVHTEDICGSRREKSIVNEIEVFLYQCAVLP